MAGTDLGRPWLEDNYEAAFSKLTQSKCFRFEDDVDVLSSVNICFAHPSVAVQIVMIALFDDDSKL